MYHFPTFYESFQAFNLIYSVFLVIFSVWRWILVSSGRGSRLLFWSVDRAYVASVGAVIMTAAGMLFCYHYKV